MERRKFIKNSCLACASFISAGGLLSILQSCASLETLKVFPENGLINIPLTKFSENNKIVILKNFDYLDFDIAVVKYNENEFKAFELQCTHQPNNPLIATETGFFCNTHGSTFSLDGKVVKSPATKNLKEYKVEITPEILKIKI